MRILNMNYRSTADLANCIRENLYKIPRDIELIVGLPRSGMLAASLTALNLNLKLTDLSGLINDTLLMNGRTRTTRFSNIKKPSDACSILVIDDSIDSGQTMQNAKNLIAPIFGHKKISYCAVYATASSSDKLDIFLDLVLQPRIFEWNVLHRLFLSECCVDIDGVLCVDPDEAENDDGSAYLNFLMHARPKVIPSYPIGYLVTSRLEKYRKETECWLRQHGIIYEHLYMLNLPDAETRKRLACHASYKADIYKSLIKAKLFIESEPKQAHEIAKLTGKPVLSFTTQILY